MTAPVSKHHLMPVLPAAFSPAPLDTTIPAPGAGLLSRAANTVRTFWSRTATINELRGLTDYELADIGLNRGNIHRAFDPGFAAEYARRR